MNQIGLIRLLELLFERLKSFVRRFPIASLTTVVFLIAVMVLNDRMKSLTERHIVVLCGPKGGNAERRIMAIQEYQKKHPEHTYWTRRYVLEPVQTDGFEENRQLIDEDRAGNMIGFAHDGFALPQNVRSLLPLTESYLHIFAHNSLIISAANPTSAGNSTTVSGANFQDISAALLAGEANGKVYLGAPSSGTRQIALVVLNHFGLNVEKLEMPGTSSWNWNDLAKEIEAGSVLLAFAAIPPEPDNFITRIAKAGECRLVSIPDVEGVRLGRRFLLSRTIPKGAYSGTTNFCQEDVHTLATTNLLICSSAMDETDAYFLASLAREALRAEIPEVDWKRNSEAKSIPEELTFLLHPGSQLLRDNKPLSWVSTANKLWLFAFAPFLLSLSQWLITQAVNRLDPSVQKTKEDDAEESSQTSTTEVGDAALDQELPGDIRERALNAAIKGLGNGEYSDQDRMAYLDILARFGDENEEARQAICRVAAEDQASQELRLECIARLGEIVRTDRQVTQTLKGLEKSKDRTIADSARHCLQQLRSMHHASPKSIKGVIDGLE